MTTVNSITKIRKFSVLFTILLLFGVLQVYAGSQIGLQQAEESEKELFIKILQDPQVLKEYANMKHVAENAKLYSKNNKIYFDAHDTAELNRISNQIFAQIKRRYHIDLMEFKVHTYIGKDQKNSCYQYYNSIAPHSVGKDCRHYSRDFSSCNQCNTYLDKLHAHYPHYIFQSHWWIDQDIISRVEPITLPNGDKAYAGLEFSPDKSIASNILHQD